MLSFGISECGIVEMIFCSVNFNMKYGNFNDEKGKTCTSMDEILLVSCRKKEPKNVF